MRIAALALSTVLLSGCSWIDLGGHNNTSGSNYNNSGRYGSASAQSYNKKRSSQYGMQQNNMQQFGPTSRSSACEITSVSHPVPKGCSAEQVTIALPGANNQGFQGQASQTPSVSSYGTSTNTKRSSSTSLRTNADNKSWTRPKLRLSGSLGLENSVSGSLFNAKSELASLYDPSAQFESVLTGSQANGQTTRVEYYVPNPAGTPSASSANTGFVFANGPTISVSDAYSLPVTASLGAEYQLSPNVSVFGNVAHSAYGGEAGGSVSYQGDVEQYSLVTDFQEITDPVTGDVTGYTAFPGTPSYATLNNAPLGSTTIELNDLQRTSAEVGGRYYFENAFSDYLERPLTPYVGAKIGAAHYNALEAKQSLQTLYLQNYFENGTATYKTDLALLGSPTQVLDKGWVATGGLTVGAEWQINPKTALAFESGLQIETGRSFSTGGTTDYNMSIPLTLRGSVGF